MCPIQNLEPNPDETIDKILSGKLNIIQSKKGYRFSIDALLLADFAVKFSKGLVADLGTGCGIVALAMLTQNPKITVVGLEIQQILATQAFRNGKLNKLTERFMVVQGDVKNIPFKDASFDVVVSNPPFRKPRTGLLSPDATKAIAKTQLLVSLKDIVGTASYLLKPKGSFIVVYPASLCTELLLVLRRNGLEPKNMRFQHPAKDKRAELVLVEARKGAKPGINVEPPIYNQGPYTNTCPTET